MSWKYKVTGDDVEGNLNPKFQSPAKGSLVTSNGSTTSIPPTNSDGTQTNAVNAALNANKTRSRMQFNPAFEARVDAAFDRQRMRSEARNKKLTGFQGDIKSSFTEKSEKGSKLYEKNLALEKRLNKRFNQPVSGEGPTPKLDKKKLKPTGSRKAKNMAAKQAADEERFSNIAKQLPKPIDLSESVKDTRLLIDQPIKKEFFNKGKIVDGVSIGRGSDKSTVSSSSFNRAGKYNTAESSKGAFIKSEKPGKTVFNYANTKDYKLGQEAKPGIENITFDIKKYK